MRARADQRGYRLRARAARRAAAAHRARELWVRNRPDAITADVAAVLEAAATMLLACDGGERLRAAADVRAAVIEQRLHRRAVLNTLENLRDDGRYRGRVRRDGRGLLKTDKPV